MEADRREAARFFRMHFGDLPGTEIEPGVLRTICVWSTPAKEAFFCTSAEEAAEHAARLSDAGENAYFGCSLVRGALSRGRRGDKAQMAAIRSVWCDLDFLGDAAAHVQKPGGKRIIPDEQKAREILAAIGVPPSITVASGHGFHCYWVLSEPVLLSSDTERIETETHLTQPWVDTVRTVANKFGYDVDAVHDLTRVLRVPGTVNWKNKADPRLVEIDQPKAGKEPKVYERGTLEAFIVPPQLAVGPRSNGSSKDVKIDPVALAPLSKKRQEELSSIIEGLCQNDPKFRQTWEHKRRDLKDKSASGYDMALGSTMAAAGCSDQDIADAILWRRTRTNEEPQKARRRSYVMKTLENIRKNPDNNDLFNRMEVLTTMTDRSERVKKSNGVPLSVIPNGGATEDAAVGEPGSVVETTAVSEAQTGEPVAASPIDVVGDPPVTVTEADRERDREAEDVRRESLTEEERRRLAMEYASEAFGLGISAVIKAGTDAEPYYSITTVSGCDIRIGKIDKLHSQTHVKQRLSISGQVPSEMKPSQWKKMVELMIKFATVIEDAGSTRVGEMSEWMQEYFRELNHESYNNGQWPQGVKRRAPIVRNGKAYIHLASMQLWIFTAKGVRRTEDELRDQLRVSGWKPEKNPFQLSRKGQPSEKVRYWVGPLKMAMPDPIDQHRGPKGFSVEESEDDGGGVPAPDGESE